MLAGLSNIPHTAEEWLIWAWHHRDSHDRIRRGIKTTYGVDLTSYQIEPINPNDMGSFLQRNASLHGDMNATLGLQSTNLLDANFQKPNELEAWIKLHAQEHYFAETKLGAAVV